MAETTERNAEQSATQQHGDISSEKDTAEGVEQVPSHSASEDPTGMEKSHVSPGEVMSLKECCREAFGKITEYLQGELSGKLMCAKLVIKT